MRKLIPLLIATVTVGCPLAHAQPLAPQGATVVSSEPGKVAAVSVIEATATVVEIHAATRTVTLMGPQGRLLDIVCGDEVRNFAQIQVGDNVTVRYQEALTLELKKTRAPSDAGGAAGAMRAEPGARPAAAAAHAVAVIADVVAVDPVKSTITLRGPAGREVELKIRNQDHFTVVKKGDQVEAVYSEAVALAVTPTPNSVKR